jgi:hypothetical protein
MPPFEYQTFIDPYVGSIASLVGAEGRAQASAAEEIAAIRAQEALQRGQAWGGAIEGIGRIAADYMSPEARRARELEKAKKINVDRSGEMQQHIGMRRVLGHAVPEIVPPGQTDPVAGMYGNALLGGDALVGTSPGGRSSVDKYGNALLGGDALVGTSPDTSPLSRGLEGAFGTVREGRTPDDLQAYQRDPVSRYTTKDGLYDIKLAYSDMLEAGISPEVANMIAKQGLEANTIFSAADDIAKKFMESQIEVRGTISQMAIALHEASPGMSWDEALESTIGPGMTRENPKELEAFQNMFVQQSPEGKENILRGYVDAWERQGEKTVIPAGAQWLSDVTGQVITPPSFRPSATGAAAAFERTTDDYQIRNPDGSWSEPTNLLYRKDLGEFYLSREHYDAGDPLRSEDMRVVTDSGVSAQDWVPMTNPETGARTAVVKGSPLYQTLVKDGYFEGVTLSERESFVAARDAEEARRKNEHEHAIDQLAQLDILMPQALDTDGNPIPGQYEPTDAFRVTQGKSSWAVGLTVPGSEIQNAQSVVDYLVANRILATIDRMKAQSQTGATGFGQLSEAELLVLQQAATRLGRPGISEDDAIQALVDLRRLYEKALQNTFLPSESVSGVSFQDEQPLRLKP